MAHPASHATAKIIIKATTLNRDIGFADYIVVEMSDEFRKEILRKRELYQMVKSQASDLCSMQFWGIYGDFYEGHFPDEDLGLTKAQVQEFEVNECLKLPDNFDMPDAKEPVRIDCAHMVITDRGFFFRATVKHTDVYVESVELKYETVLEPGT